MKGYYSVSTLFLFTFVYIIFFQREMALTTVDYNSYFNYKLSQKQLTFTDKTDFPAQGTVAANVTVVAKITAPVTGVFYNNTNHSLPDIDCGTSLDSIITIPLPLDGGTGLPEQGEYTIELTYVDSVVASTVVDVRTFTLDYNSSVVDLTMTVDCISPLLKSVDSTGYTKNLIDPTVTRAMAINYPLSMEIAPVTGTANSISTSVIYVVTGQTIEYSSSLTSNLSYLFDVANSMYVIDEISGSEYIGVACDGDLCNIYCCIKSQYNRWQDAKGVSTTRANIELAKFEQITSIAEMVGTALKCGKSTDISGFVAEILAIADCDSGCSCDDGTPQLVTGLAVSGDAVIVDEGTGMSVTSVSGGGTTTYTVSLSPTNVTKLSNMTNSIVAAGTNTSVGSGSATVGGIQTFTYTVNATDTIVESSFVRVGIILNTSVVPTISITNQQNYGTVLTTVNQSGTGTDFITNNNVSTFADWTGSYTGFDVANFGSPGTVFFPEAVVLNIVGSGKGSSLTWINSIKVDIVSVGTDTFSFRFSDELGNPINGLYLQDRYAQLELIFKIQA